MRRRQALIWCADRAGANHHLLTYTSWPPHTGLFSIASCKNKIIAFGILVRAAWLHLWQVTAIMSDCRKWQVLILSLWWGRGSRAHTSRAELFSPHLRLLWPFSSHYLSFQPTDLSWFTLLKLCGSSHNFSFFLVSSPESLLLVTFQSENVMPWCINLTRFHFIMPIKWDRGV